jgi:hypothetical protein
LQRHGEFEAARTTLYRDAEWRFLERVDAALEAIEARIAVSLQVMEQDPAIRGVNGPYFESMARGAVAMQRTRLEWVRGVLAALRAGEMVWPTRPPERHHS